MRELFSYVERFRNDRFVVKIDDGIVRHDAFDSFVEDLAHVARVGVRLLLVAGARGRIEEILARYGMSGELIDGTRISPPAAMPLIEMAAFDVATKIMTRVTGYGIDAVIGNWVRARTLGVVNGVDYLNTGEVDRIELRHVERLLDDGVVPIFPCIGWNRRGEPYNISSDRLAGDLAVAVGATKLLFCLAGPTRLPDRITADEAEALSARPAETPTDPKTDASESVLLEVSARVCRAGVDRVQIIDGTTDGMLLREVFTNIGAGTMIYASEYASIRPFRPSDATAVLRIMQPAIRNGRLLPRSVADIESCADRLVVYTIDGTVHGVAGFASIGEHEGEVFALAVDDAVADLGVGKELVEYLLDRAQKEGFARVFALTTQAYDWFLRWGFRGATVADLPPSRRKSYDCTRNSRILVRELR